MTAIHNAFAKEPADPFGKPVRKLPPLNRKLSLDVMAAALIK